MNLLLNLKLIVRSWWRNKMYFCISLVSLTIGLACTNLLVTFFIHEYNLESTNPNRKNIYILRQNLPMKETGKTPYVMSNASGQIKNNYAEVEGLLRMEEPAFTHFRHDGNEIAKGTLLETEPSLPDFFDYTVKEGSLKEALSAPGKVALSEAYAKKVFGNQSGMGQTIEAFTLKGEQKVYQVAAIVAERPQSFLQFDMLTAIDGNFQGGTTLLKLAAGTDIDALEQKLKDDNVPTLLPGMTFYHLDPMKEVCFSDDADSPIPGYLHKTNVQLLYIALASALLVLAIACFNYSNLNLSRTLQQLKMIHIEKLMGAQLREIRMQLFFDAALTILLSFLLALLLINDILPLFNGLLSVRLPYRFFFNGQVLPVLLVFVLLLAVTPGLYISRRLSRQSLSRFRMQYTGRGKQRVVWTLVGLQFVLSLMLVHATLTARNQMNLIESRAFRYEQVIEIGDMMSGPALQPFQQRLKTQKGIEAMTLSNNGLTGWSTELILKRPDGSEDLHTKTFFHTDSSFFSTLNLRLKEGLPPSEALEKFGNPYYINESYARLAGVRSEDIGVKRMKEITPATTPNAENMLAGIIENFPTASLDQEVLPQEILLYDTGSSYLTQTGKYLQIRLNPTLRKETLARMEQIWQEMYDGRSFVYTDLHQTFLERNREVMQLAQILNTYSLIALVLTCFGLFGISWYAVRQRTREIAIRKIHGASTAGIVWLLNRPFFMLMGVAYLVAMPTVWWLMQHWLEQFVYRADSHFGLFVWPLVTVAAVSFLTVSLHTTLAAKSDPTRSLKTE